MKNDFLPLPSTTAFSQLGQEKINLNQLIRLNRVEGMMMMGGGGAGSMRLKINIQIKK